MKELHINNIKRLHICDQPHKHWYEYLYNSHYSGSPHNSKHMFDIYSLTHLFWPLLLMWIAKKIFPYNGWIPIILIILTTVFEIHENMKSQIVKYNRIEINESGKSSYRGDSTVNIIGDIIFNILGIYIGYKLTSDLAIFLILFVTFIIVTGIVGISYWIEFFDFMTS